MNSPAPGGPPTELVPSGDLKRAPASPPSLSRVQEGGLQVSRLALACLSPGLRRPLPSRSQGGRPGRSGAVRAPAAGSCSLFCSPRSCPALQRVEREVPAPGARAARARRGRDPLRPRCRPALRRTLQVPRPQAPPPEETRSRPSRPLLAPPPSGRPPPVQRASRSARWPGRGRWETGTSSGTQGQVSR